MKLSRRDVGLITEVVGDTFQRLKAALLGRFFLGPHIYFEVDRPDPSHSLEAIYQYTGSLMYGPGFSQDDEHMRQAAEVASNYVEAQKLRTINQVVQGFKSAQNLEETQAILKDALDRAGSYVSMLVTSEARIMQATAEKDGIARVAADMGIADPNVAFRGRFDDKTCKYCRKMYHSRKNPAIPRVYKLSELTGGYFKPKAWDGQTPHGAPLHPHCRHLMTFIPPNHGFNSSGQIEFKRFGYDVYQEQMEKGESPLVSDVDDGPECECGIGEALSPNL